MKIVAAKSAGFAVWVSADSYDYRKVKYTDENEMMLALEVPSARLCKVLLNNGLVGYIDPEHVYEVSP